VRPGKKTDRAERVKSVERQYYVAETARESLEAALRAHPTLLTGIGLDAADLRAFKSNLLDTYFIRLFAEFETAIKDYWKNGLGEDPGTRIMDVIDSLAARRRVLDAVRVNVHAARKWRNMLVHEDDTDATRVELTSARRSFGKFLGFLPDDW
jgi:hypothetical protein